MTLAVFDLGKTNSKLFVFNDQGEIVDEQRTPPVWREEGAFRVLDDKALFGWMERALREAVIRHDVSGVTFSGHGCTFALINEDGLTHSILDYEQEPPEEIAGRIDALIPAFAETFSPRLPLGFNYGRHMLWLEDVAPQSFGSASAILGYPQFWSWKFSGKPVSEISYLGCHSHLWAPLARDFSTLVKERNWQAKMPPMARAGDRIGSYSVQTGDGKTTEIAVYNGVHDSNAALYNYRSMGFRSFTLVSTGTWVIIFNADCPLGSLNENRDMLANVSVDGEPVATIRFMGGREFDMISEGWKQAVSFDDMQSVIDKGIFALPSFAAGGPVSETRGVLEGPEPGAAERAAAAMLYVALMTDLSLDEIRSENTVIVDGGLTRNGTYVSILAQLRPDQQFLQSANTEGSATGAAALAFEAMGQNPFTDRPQSVYASKLERLSDYRTAWRSRIEERRSSPSVNHAGLERAS